MAVPGSTVVRSGPIRVNSTRVGGTTASTAAAGRGGVFTGLKSRFANNWKANGGLKGGSLKRGGAWGIAGTLAGGALTDDTGGVRDYLGHAAQGAAYGAGIGSIIPGVGTAVGAGVGAVGGLAWELFDDDTPEKKMWADEMYSSGPRKTYQVDGRGPTYTTQGGIITSVGPAKGSGSGGGGPTGVPPIRRAAPSYQADQQYAGAVNAAMKGIAAELSMIEAQRAARKQEIASRYSINAPTAGEQKLLSESLARIDADTDYAKGQVAKNYGAALNVAKAQYSIAEKVAASTKGDIERYYNAAADGVNATNSEVMRASAAAAGNAGFGMGGTVAGGEATMMDDVIRSEGMKAAASSADQMATRRDDVAFMRDNLVQTQAQEQSDVVRAQQTARSDANLAWNAAVQQRQNEDRRSMYSALDTTDQNFDNRAWGLRDQSRALPVEYAASEAQNRATWNQEVQAYDLANQTDDYDRDMSAYQRGAQAGTGSGGSIAAMLAATETFPKQTVRAADVVPGVYTAPDEAWDPDRLGKQIALALTAADDPNLTAEERAQAYNNIALSDAQFRYLSDKPGFRDHPYFQGRTY